MSYVPSICVTCFNILRLINSLYVKSSYIFSIKLAKNIHIQDIAIRFFIRTILFIVCLPVERFVSSPLLNFQDIWLFSISECKIVRVWCGGGRGEKPGTEISGRLSNINLWMAWLTKIYIQNLSTRVQRLPIANTKRQGNRFEEGFYLQIFSFFNRFSIDFLTFCPHSNCFTSYFLNKISLRNL